MKDTISELEKKYQATSDVDELYAVDKKYQMYLEKHLETNQKDIKALIHLGVLCWEPFHEQEKAIQYLTKAVAYDPQNIDARFWLAKCYYHDYCNYEKAKSLILEALKIDLNRADCLSLLASIILDTTENLNESIAYLEKAVNQAPDWPMLRFSLASFYLEKNQIQLAEQQVSKIQELANPPLNLRNAIEDYYETIVTGRNKENILVSIQNLKERIRKTKLRSKI